MAKFTMRVRTKDGREWDEEYNKPNARNQASAERCAQSIIKYFNSTLRPHEQPRSVVSVTFGEGNASLSHIWEKTNLYTIRLRGRTYDTAECSVCHITGKRFGLGDVVRDSQFKARGYGSCDTAKVLLAKRSVKSRA